LRDRNTQPHKGNNGHHCHTPRHLKHERLQVEDDSFREFFLNLHRLLNAMEGVRMSDNRPLTSWKEIAAHLGKGVRTVQRWERERGLPVRRPSLVDKHIVVALPEDLDEWLRTRAGPLQEPAPPPARPVTTRRISPRDYDSDLERLKYLRQLTRARCDELTRKSAELMRETEQLLLRRRSEEKKITEM
jgi:hypothetical protein